MLQWFFPVWDTFALYGREVAAGRLFTGSLLNCVTRSPNGRASCLEILDVEGHITTEGSANWKESERRRRLKEADVQRKSNEDTKPPT